MKKRIYIDTSVIGGYFDEEFKFSTRLFFDLFLNQMIIFVVSDLLELELIRAPLRVKTLLSNFDKGIIEKIDLTEESILLADKYIEEKVVGKSSLEDCRHIALATVSRVDVLASWNFKHIVNLDKIHAFNAVNLNLGYPILEIRSPNDLIYYGTEG